MRDIRFAEVDAEADINADADTDADTDCDADTDTDADAKDDTEDEAEDEAEDDGWLDCFDFLAVGFARQRVFSKSNLAPFNVSGMLLFGGRFERSSTRSVFPRGRGVLAVTPTLRRRISFS